MANRPTDADLQYLGQLVEGYYSHLTPQEQEFLSSLSEYDCWTSKQTIKFDELVLRKLRQ